MNKFRLLTLALLCLLSAAIASAQSGLDINQAFSDRYRDMKGATETLVVKNKLRKVNLDIYHSMAFTDHPELGPTLERLVASDGKKAIAKEVRYKAGHLYYGFYRLPAAPHGTNRYILYLNGHLNGDNRIILLYLEGAATPEQVKKMLK